MSTSLMWLLDGIATASNIESRDVIDLTLDSREVRPGSLFFALPGRSRHGIEFAAEAAARGASVVLWEPAPGVELPKLPPSVFAAAIPGLKDLVGRIADRFFNWPSSQLRITGITGTNGKTTCAYLLAQCLERLGSAAAYMGTIGWGRTASLIPSPLTTPDVVTLNRELAQLRASGVREVAMEVSSQALDQDRVAGVRFHSAAFTNLSRDHLDYHESMAAYGAAKARLFCAPDLQHIIINVGDAFGREFALSYAGRVPLTAIWIGAGDSGWLAERAVRAAEVSLEAQGISMQLDGTFGKAHVNTHLLGRFNAENSLVVIACLLSRGASLAEAARALAECAPPPGRMEVVEPAGGGKPMAVVDYAHTPDALSKALSALREHCQGSLWCVFGCGGDRDPGKRPLMGAIADELADQIIVTDDNPRSENPQAITRAIASGIKSRAVRIIHDRGAAIGAALTEARAQDIVLIAGKGHEDYQIYGDTRRSFSDRREAQR
ncbi:MAG TPA: UDP-N-acetylmuramoyl-L-alanyl-D-glutamate--2,6-diaminopimelate ligase, partial [Steroidobacteraceae bacterium]|nr:UDP-N-acetylmuramoyl-L-alanyl-D-glutamate--2,6-diaminopimelate ligase [Steroidobacteraceae bacterium]